jgi:hypothetical protein
VLAAPSNADEASEALQALLGDHPYGLPGFDHIDEARLMRRATSRN